jgi:hypothetical protein
VTNPGKGESETSPRVRGAQLFAIGLVLNGFNVVLVRTESTYSTLALLLGPALMLVGFWRLVLGRRLDPYTGHTARWYQVGSVLAGVCGLLVSLVALTLLE